MREHPWHMRRATTEHYRRFLDLTDLHAITRAWIAELEVERQDYMLARGPADHASIAPVVERFESLTKQGPWAKDALESLLDETLPEDVLSRLESAIWNMQEWTLAGILESAKAADRPALLNQLEQASFKAGRDCAGRRWPRLPAEQRESMASLLDAFRDSPFSHYPALDGYLVQRAVKDEGRLELRLCPHQRSPQYSHVDELCLLHTHWMRGYVYALNSRAVIDYHPGSGADRCEQRWRFAE